MRLSHFLIFICVCFAAEAVPAASATTQQTPIDAVRVEPLQFNALTGVKIEPVLAEGSPDFDFEYRWFLNGEENYFQTSSCFPGDLLRRGDKLSISVTPITFLGEKFASYISMPLEAVNSPPSILSNPPDKFGPEGYYYQVEANDLDGDVITYRLEQNPQGMTIDNANGKLKWIFEKFPEGVFPVLIVAEDGFGGRAEQQFELNLSLVPKGKAK